MKKLIFSLMMLTSISIFAGNPEKTTKVTKPSIVMIPQPVTNPDALPCFGGGYIYNGNCLIQHLYCGSSGAYTIVICTDHGTIIAHDLEVFDDGNPHNVGMAANIGIINGTLDPNKDPISQLIDLNRVKNATMSIDTDMTIETDQSFLVYKAGKYQIVDSNLEVTLTITH